MPKTMVAPPPGIYHGTPMEEYLAWNAWSRSDLAAFLPGPEYVYKRRFGDDEGGSKEASLGTMAHTLILEPHLWPPADVAWIPGPYNVNPGKKESTEAKLRGFRPFKPEDREAVEAMARAFHQDEIAALLLKQAGPDREVTAVATDSETGLLCKARVDFWIPEKGMLVDLKTTTRGVDEESFSKRLWGDGGDGHWLSAPHYLDVFSRASGVACDCYLWINVDQDDPWAVRIYEADEDMLAQSRPALHKMRRLALAADASGVWKAPSLIRPVGLPIWAQRTLARWVEAGE